MTTEITIGVWILPLFGTILAFVAAFWFMPKASGDYDFVTPFLGLGLLLVAAIASLAMWLAWSLLA